MALLIVALVIAGFCLTPLVLPITGKYKTTLRVLIGIGFFWLAFMVMCRWLYPSGYAPENRAYEWRYGPVPVQVSLSLYLFFSFIAAGIGLALLWVEYRFYRLAPSPQDRRHLLIDSILVGAYLAAFIAFIELW